MRPIQEVIHIPLLVAALRAGPPCVTLICLAFFCTFESVTERICAFSLHRCVGRCAIV